VRAFIYWLIITFLGLPATSMAAAIVWVNQEGSANKDKVEIKFDSQEPHTSNSKMFRLISYRASKKGCQLTASYTRSVAEGTDQAWDIGFIKGPSGKDKTLCLFPNEEVVKTGDIVMYRKIDEDTLELRLGVGDPGEFVEEEKFYSQFTLK